MTHDEKLDKVEQGIDNLAELLGIKSSELVEIISVGFVLNFESAPDEVYELLDDLDNTFRDF